MTRFGTVIGSTDLGKFATNKEALLAALKDGPATNAQLHKTLSEKGFYASKTGYHAMSADLTRLPEIVCVRRGLWALAPEGNIPKQTVRNIRRIHNSHPKMDELISVAHKLDDKLLDDLIKTAKNLFKRERAAQLRKELAELEAE